MRVSLFIVVLSCLVCACTEREAVTRAEESLAELCRWQWSTPEAEATHLLDLVEAAVARSEANDLRCGLLPETERQCRALAVAGLVDPVAFLGEPDRLDQSLELFLWATGEGALASEGDVDLTEAWAQLADSTTKLAVGQSDEIRANVLRDRAQLDVINELGEAEDSCSS